MFPRCKVLCSLRIQAKVPSRSNSTGLRDAIKQKRNQLFAEEKKRQKDSIGRIESIRVLYKSPGEDIHLSMNKYISTPLDCTRHVSGGLTKLAAVALVDDKVWDLHKPLVSNCELKIVTLLNPEVLAANTAFWRTCALMLGGVAESAFKDKVQVYPHSFPQPQIKSGSFVHDVFLDLPSWQPTPMELRALSASFVKTMTEDIEIERLDVTEEVASKLFEDNPFKLAQIPNVARNNDDKVTLYKVGDYVDISKGPLIANTHAIGRLTVAAVHKSPLDSTQNLYRFQGVAIPKGIMLNHFAYSLLEARARILNETMWVPQSVIQGPEEDVPLKTVAASN